MATLPMKYDPKILGPQVYWHPKDLRRPESERRVVIRRSHYRCMVVNVPNAIRLGELLEQLRKVWA